MQSTDTLVNYEPVVDPGQTDPAKFSKDLEDCRSVALRVEADYRQRQQEELGRNLLIGALAGAATGAVVGNNTSYMKEAITYGAVAGAATGAASGDYTHDLVKFGPRRVVDRCMANRGHAILNDIGRG